MQTENSRHVSTMLHSFGVLKQHEWTSCSRVRQSSAGPCRAQQRGQSPHTAVMWHPDGTRAAPAFFLLKKGPEEFLWLMLRSGETFQTFTLFSLSYIELISQIPAAGRFIYFQLFPATLSHAKTEKCLLCECKQSSSIIYTLLSRAFVRSLVSQ